MTPKWSSKKAASQKKLVLDDSDAEWDSEDEELINHFYPEISPQELPIEYKRKLKHQIILALAAREDGDNENGSLTDQTTEVDGIYLGTRPHKSSNYGRENDGERDYEENDYERDYERNLDTAEESDDEFNYEIPDLEAKLSDFLILAKPQKSRKILKNNILENFLEEYGIDSLQSTVKDFDYNELLRNNIKQIAKMDISKLSGHRIGDSLNKQPKTNNIRVLTEQEKQDHLDREKKLEHARFYNQIKSTFGMQNEKKSSKVLEINNFDSKDERQVELLNMRIAKDGSQSVNTNDLNDLDALLGLSKVEKTGSESVTLDNLIRESKTLTESQPPKITRKIPIGNHNDDALLDDLIGL